MSLLASCLWPVNGSWQLHPGNHSTVQTFFSHSALETAGQISKSCDERRNSRSSYFPPQSLGYRAALIYQARTSLRTLTDHPSVHIPALSEVVNFLCFEYHKTLYPAGPTYITPLPTPLILWVDPRDGQPSSRLSSPSHIATYAGTPIYTSKMLSNFGLTAILATLCKSSSPENAVGSSVPSIVLLTTCL